jgi:hypothetical protein
MKTRLFRYSITLILLGFITGALVRPSTVYAATAMDGFGNISDFSLNADALLYLRIPSVVAWILVLGAAGAGSALMVVIYIALKSRRKPELHDNMVHCRQIHATASRAAANSEAEQKAAKDDLPDDSLGATTDGDDLIQCNMEGGVEPLQGDLARSNPKREGDVQYQPYSLSKLIGLGLLGGLLGAGIGIGLLALPFVHIQWPQGQQGGQAKSSAPSCSKFIDEALIQPENGTVFTSGTDVIIELSPQPDPPGMQTRWFLDVTDPDNTTLSKMLSSNSISLSALGFDPKRTGIYFWKLRGERAKTGSNAWTPLCTDSVQRMFQVQASTASLLTTTPDLSHIWQAFDAEDERLGSLQSELQGDELLQNTPTATLLQNAYCLHGPAVGYGSVTILYQGVQVPIEGRNQDGTWWYVLPPKSQIHCWVGGSMVQTSGNVNGVPVVKPPPLGCWVYKPNQQKNVCTVPCPEGAKPGGACEP